MGHKNTISVFVSHAKVHGQTSSLNGGKYNMHRELEAQIHKMIDKTSLKSTRLKESDINRAIRFYEDKFSDSASMERYVVFTQLDPTNNKTKIRLVIPSESIAVLKDIMEKRPFSVTDHPNIRFERKIILESVETVDEFPIDAVSLRLSKEDYPDLRQEGIENLVMFINEIVTPSKTRPVLFKIVNRRKYMVAPGVAVFISQEFKSDRSMDEISLQMSTVSASKAMPLYSIEIEIVDFSALKSKSVEDIQDLIFSEVYRGLAVLQGDQIARKPSFYREDLAFLSGPLAKWRHMFTAVRTMSRQQLSKMKTGDNDTVFAVSPKADGVTAAVIINPYGLVYIYDIVSEMIMVTNALVPDSIGGTILEGEFIRKQNRVFVYDILVYNTKDIRDELYFDRVKILDNMFDNLKISWHEDYYGPKFTFTKKDIFIPSTENVSVSDSNQESFRQVRRMMESSEYEFETDGVIFTGNSPYPYAKNTSRRVNARDIIKYKPLDATTVDFLVRYEKDSAGLPVIEMVDSVRYRNIAFYVYKRTRDNIRVEAVRVYHDLFPVNSRGLYVLSEGNEVIDDSIIEGKYSPATRTWEIVRMREDKTDRYRIMGLSERTANALTTYEATISVIEDPISIDELEQGSAYYAVTGTDAGKTVRKVINALKRVLIDTAIGYIVDGHGEFSHGDEHSKKAGPWVVDFSIGQGGDLQKYSGAEYVFGMDIDPGNLTTAKSRTDALRINNVSFSQGDATLSIKSLAAFSNKRDALEKWTRDEDYALKTAPTGLYDVGVLNFTLTHFFGSSKSLDGFIKNVSDALRPGGILIVTTIDGDEVAATINGSDEPVVSNSKFWAFWDPKKSLSKKSVFGREYQYRIKSISETFYSEYATNIPEFLKRAKKFGIVPAVNVVEKPVSSFTDMDAGLIEDMPEFAREYIEMVSSSEITSLSDEKLFTMHKYLILTKSHE